MNEETLKLMDELAHKCVNLNADATKEVRKIRDQLRNDIWDLVREFRKKSGIKEDQFWVNNIKPSLYGKEPAINVEIDTPYILTHHGDKDIMDAFITAITKAQIERKEEQSSD